MQVKKIDCKNGLCYPQYNFWRLREVLRMTFVIRSITSGGYEDRLKEWTSLSEV
jgi:hypothetical protein